MLFFSLFVLFFAVSHTQKEFVRAKLPIHLSDGVIAFFIGILFLFTAFLIAGMNRILTGVANVVEIGDGLTFFGMSSIFYIL